MSTIDAATLNALNGGAAAANRSVVCKKEALCRRKRPGRVYGHVDDKLSHT